MKSYYGAAFEHKSIVTWFIVVPLLFSLLLAGLLPDWLPARPQFPVQQVTEDSGT